MMMMMMMNLRITFMGLANVTIDIEWNWRTCWEWLWGLWQRLWLWPQHRHCWCSASESPPGAHQCAAGQCWACPISHTQNKPNQHSLPKLTINIHELMDLGLWNCAHKRWETDQPNHCLYWSSPKIIVSVNLIDSPFRYLQKIKVFQAHNNRTQPARPVVDGWKKTTVLALGFPMLGNSPLWIEVILCHTITMNKTGNVRKFACNSRSMCAYFGHIPILLGLSFLNNPHPDMGMSKKLAPLVIHSWWSLFAIEINQFRGPESSKPVQE